MTMNSLEQPGVEKMVPAEAEVQPTHAQTAEDLSVLGPILWVKCRPYTFKSEPFRQRVQPQGMSGRPMRAGRATTKFYNFQGLLMEEILHHL